jgi:hypothetical protein
MVFGVFDEYAVISVKIDIVLQKMTDDVSDLIDLVQDTQIGLSSTTKVISNLKFTNDLGRSSQFEE